MDSKAIKFFNASTERGGLGWTYAQIGVKYGNISDVAILKWVKKDRIPKEREDRTRELLLEFRFSKVYPLPQTPGTTASQVAAQIKESGIPVNKLGRYLGATPGVIEMIFERPEEADNFFLYSLQRAFHNIKLECSVAHDLFDNFVKNNYNQTMPETNQSLQGLGTTLPGGATSPF